MKTGITARIIIMKFKNKRKRICKAWIRDNKEVSIEDKN
jgi:hypothetical protein